MHTSQENGIANEAIVLQWWVQSDSWDFKDVYRTLENTGVIFVYKSAALLISDGYTNWSECERAPF